MKGEVTIQVWTELLEREHVRVMRLPEGSMERSDRLMMLVTLKAQVKTLKEVMVNG